MIIWNSIIFYILSCTWGIIMTLLGSLGALALIITGHKPTKHGHCVHFEVGTGWGGVNFGPFFFTSKRASDNTKNHEHGHGFQNAVLGPLFVFLVAIPSITRAALYDLDGRKKKVTFSVILYALLMLIAAGISVVAIMFQPWVLVLSVFIAVYSTILFCWLMFTEIPKHDNGPVDYYSIWFEGQASKLGNDFIAAINH